MSNKRRHVVQRTTTSILSRCLFIVPLACSLSFASGDTLHIFESRALGIHFSYPSEFVVGRFDSTHDLTGHFRKMIVLVDPHELGDYSRNAIPVGDLPTIAIGVESDTAGIVLKPFTDIDIVRKFFSVDLRDQEFKKTIGVNTAYRLPGYPGPYGEALYYYLVPLADGRYVELTAHRYFFRKRRDSPTETLYDNVIEKIIATLTVDGMEADSILVGFNSLSGEWIKPLDEFYGSDNGDIDIESSLKNGNVPVVRIDINGDGVQEYFVRILCGSGGCEYPIFDGRTRRFLGSVFGSEIWLLRHTSNNVPVIKSFSHVSASTGMVTRYQFRGTRYEATSSHEIPAGSETETLYRRVNSAPRVK
jgi:hypothetical protein